MGLSPDVLYNAISSDVCYYSPCPQMGAANLAPDASYQQVASTALLSSLLKKWVYSNTRNADLAAKEKFLAFNKKCKDWCLVLDEVWDQELYGNFLKEVDLFLHPNSRMLFDSYWYILEAGRTGPGSSLGANGQSMYAKLFSSKMTATSDELYLMYSTYVKMYPEWSNAEIIRYLHHGKYSYVDSSRSSFVPKSEDISRMICTEPSLNMFFQLGLGSLIEGRMRQVFNLDLSLQPEINQRLAQEGSIDGSFCTIDLSSASDSISLSLCETVFPPWFYQTLVELRSPNTILDGESVRLDMVSTMGNGFTFPLQTFIFSCLIRAAYHHCGLRIDDRGLKNWGCFGDDLIVDKRAYRSVVRLLGILGFQLNGSKSFSEGHFRESCGADWFNGQPVRGVYIRKLTTPQDIFVAINLLNDWSACTGINLPIGISYLISELSFKEKSFLVPFDENRDAGIRVPSLLLPKVAYDHNLSYSYRVFRAVPKSIRIGDGTVKVPRGHKRLLYNPSGLLIAFLKGEVKTGTITVRQSRVMYRSKRRCTPNWDYIPATSLLYGCKVGWERWETALQVNIGGDLEPAP